MRFRIDNRVAVMEVLRLMQPVKMPTEPPFGPRQRPKDRTAMLVGLQQACLDLQVTSLDSAVGTLNGAYKMVMECGGRGCAQGNGH